MLAPKKKCNQTQAMKAFASAGFNDVNMLRNVFDVLEDPSEFSDLFGLTSTALEDVIDTEELSVIDTLGAKYIELLHHIGIHTISQLSLSDPFDLHERLKHFVRGHSSGRVPNRATIEYWIEQARALTVDR